ncbi:hypothetical protein CLV78_103380 [Aliiruegeria haliotis]|uniref:Uncharacterized protein n=1 Tax=Aliiruegeria haliotis TaxID=1280846 RepID=A0A2T0RTV8_9RHOB|nr:hypothetical protein [Aliiruegeria haliotis]PRY24513.1 hypothetical protein CLV78_103380 [Aliiruegeria haliotis]
MGPMTGHEARKTRVSARAALVVVAGLLAAAPTQAETVIVPEGCEGFLTAQMKGCGVSHYWRCEAAPEGTTWEVHYDHEGVFSLSVYDRDFQWLDSQYFSDGTREHLVGEGPDPASLSTLLETGRDTYAFVIREEGPDGTRDVVHQGYDQLTGQTVTIDGVALLETEFSSVAMDAETGEEIYSVWGNQYVHEEERLFFIGPDTFRRDGEENANDLGPVRFVHPGEPGFTDMTPQYDCIQSEEIRFTPVPSEGLR